MPLMCGGLCGICRTATLLKVVFDAEIKDKFIVPDKETDEIINQARPEEQTIAATGIYGLTLNAENKIEHFDMIYIAEANTVQAATH
jgi:hypothetical protein